MSKLYLPELESLGYVMYDNLPNGFFRKKDDPTGAVFYKTGDGDERDVLIYEVSEDLNIALVHVRCNIPNPEELVEMLSSDAVKSAAVGMRDK